MILLTLGFALSLGAVYLVMPSYISALKRMGMNQEVSEYALEEFKQKAKTPIMGGLLFVIFPVIAAIVIKPDMLRSSEAIFVILSYLSYCLIGFLDDFLILKYHNNLGLSPKLKLLMQLVFSFILYFLFRPLMTNTVYFPFLHKELNIGWLYLPFMIFMYAAEANAVNFTDGMDGLCAGVSFFALLPFILLALSEGHLNLAVLIICVLGGLLGYLYYNHFPAKIFMGDSGSLALGGLFAALAVVMHKEIVLFFAGGVFVWEMFCVVLQLTSVILFHRRIFSYTPIHYAFRLKGIAEKRIVSSFWVISFGCAFIGFLIGVFG